LNSLSGPVSWLGVASLLICATGWAACEVPRPVTLQGKTVQEIKPRLAWEPVKGATGYRVRVLSRVPDGRVVLSQDTMVAAPEFLAPQPLAEQRAKVVVRVNAVCGAETSADAVSAFIIDATAGCALGEVTAVAAEGKTELKWRPVEGATRYEVRAFAVVDGEQLVSHETRAPGAQVDLRGRSAVVGVRPACGGVIGETVYRVVAAR
jgi:hypothetical protein